ncbi:hypothetical protein QWY93_18480 [Echinicola jeungdonensis]|uniref:hypothetical protein n=1 Tax=Echinicola jeungdonensis TaxID=709343 RepID=UPI0025B4D333|nr:hypothetical protein [Echinicola jeungdonensis]MDN3671285.1 hypothetical protein [Echinicola jeungdonensis]
MTLNYKKIGQGEPLIILHGLFWFSRQLDEYSQGVRNDFTIYLVTKGTMGKAQKVTNGPIKPWRKT